MESVKRQVQSVLGMEKVLELIKMATLQQADMKKYQERLDKKNGEISRYKKLLCSLYENVMDGVIDKEEYQKLKKNYTGLLSEAQKRAKIIRTEIRQIMESNMEEKNWLDQLKKYQNFTVLDRAVVVCLIEKILVYKNKQVEIVYNWQEEYHWLANLLLQTQDNI